MATCPQCHSPLEAEARFCGSCGSDLSEAPTVTPDPAASGSAEVSVTRVDQLLGRTLNGRYRIDRKIGEGGFGAVFEGVHLQMTRPVAIKVLHPHLVDNPQLAARFRREAQAACALRDPHTVTTHDFDRSEEGVLYIVMELIQGRSLLAELQRCGPLPLPRSLDLLDQVCGALIEAHDHEVVHRDIKPENILIEARSGSDPAQAADFVKVVDFGIARLVHDAQGDTIAKLTAAGQVFGTLEYMSPEQLNGDPVDHRSDIYSLGVTLFQMLSGALPFSGAPSKVIMGHVNEPPPLPSSLRPELPAAADNLVLRCLAKDPARRFPDVRALRQALHQLLEAGTGPQPTVTTTGKLPPRGAAPATTHKVAGPPARRRGLPTGAWIGIIGGGLGSLALIALLIGLSAANKDHEAGAPDAQAQAPTTPSTSAEPVKWARQDSLARMALPGTELTLHVRPGELLAHKGIRRAWRKLANPGARHLLNQVSNPNNLQQVLVIVPKLHPQTWQGGEGDAPFLIAGRGLDAKTLEATFIQERRSIKRAYNGVELNEADGFSLAVLDEQTLLGGHTAVVQRGLTAARGLSPRDAAFAARRRRNGAAQGLLQLRFPAHVQPEARRVFQLDRTARLERALVTLTLLEQRFSVDVEVTTNATKTAADLRRVIHDELRSSPERRGPWAWLLRRVQVEDSGPVVSLRLRGQTRRVMGRIRALLLGGAGRRRGRVRSQD